MVVGARRAGLSVSETADRLGFSHTHTHTHTQPSLGFTENANVKRLAMLACPPTRHR